MSEASGAHTPRWRRYLRFVRPNIPADVDDELTFHLDMRIERNIAFGMSLEDARREALTRFGEMNAVRGALVDHDQRKHSAEQRGEFFSDIRQDLRFGARALKRSPGFTIAAALTLALGIGANAAIFSVLNSVVLQPLPYKQPERLISIGNGFAGEYLALRERLKSMDLAMWVSQTHPVDDGTEPMRVEGATVTVNLLPLIGVSPSLGRGFTDNDAIVGNNNVVLISNGMWQRMFGGARNAVGKRINVEGVPFTIVGVMPESFHFPSNRAEYWQPYAFATSNAGLMWGIGGRSFVGRLGPNVRLEQARREVRDVWPTLRHLNPLWDPGDSYRRNTSVTPLQDDIVSTSGPLLWMLFGSVVLVLLIACVNVANLLLARATTRERELAVRAALGGGRPRLVRQLITENVLLAGLGGALGVLFAFIAVRALIGALPADMPRVEEISVNGVVLAFTAAVAIATAFLFGIVPALRATSRTTSSRSFVGFGGRATAGMSHIRISGALVTGEVALAVLLGVASLLLMRSFATLRSVSPGFAATHVVAARVSVPHSASFERATDTYRAVLSRAAGIPGVQSAAVVDKLPFAQSVWGMAVRVQGQFEDNKHTLPDLGHFQQVTPGYFATMGIALRRGRDFTDIDRAGQEPVAIISESVARKFWPNEDAIGKRIGYPFDSPWLTVVGVVPDTKQDSLRDTSTTSIYTPWAQRTRVSSTELWIVARASGDPTAIGGAIRGIVHDVDRSIPVSDVRTMDAVVSESVRTSRFVTLLVASFATLALLLGAVGIYGVMSYLVSQRSREMGIRLALGASRRAVIGLVVRRAAMLAAVGAVIGVIASLAATRSLRQLLFGISATDPLTLISVPLLFLAVAALASYAPALRATRVDPASALRAE
jgi:putative ABC transport system permease protein